MKYDALLQRLDRVRRSGHSYSARCPVHRDRNNSFSITLRDGRIWLCCHAGCSFGDILAALNIRPHELFTDERPPVDNPQSRIEAARTQWWKRSHAIKGTAVEKYLRRCRGIRIGLPPSIRCGFARHSEYNWCFPTMLAGLQDVGGNFAGVSVTWICNDGSGKAPVEPPRKIFGVLSGCAVRLASAAASLAICEGIETGLAFWQATGVPTWAALSAPNLPHVVLPNVTREVVIAADNDETGRKFARRAELAFRQSGRAVKVCLPAGRKDFAS